MAESVDRTCLEHTIPVLKGMMVKSGQGFWRLTEKIFVGNFEFRNPNFIDWKFIYTVCNNRYGNVRARA